MYYRRLGIIRVLLIISLHIHLNFGKYLSKLASITYHHLLKFLTLTNFGLASCCGSVHQLKYINENHNAAS